MTLPDKVLLPYQAQLFDLLANNNLAVVEKGRRTGYSWGAAAYSALTAGLQASAGGQDINYIGTSKEMTRQFIDDVAHFAKQFKIAAGAVQEIYLDADKEIQVFRINFASGFSVISLSSNPRSLRGRKGCVIIDEAAFLDNLEEVIKAALALTMWGGKVLVISTHNGDTNPFNQLVQDIRSGRRKGAVVRLSLDDALVQGLYKRICLVQGQTWTQAKQDAWRQDLYDTYGDGASEELDCIPNASSGSYLPTALIEQSMIDSGHIVRFDAGKEFNLKSEYVRRCHVRDWCQDTIAPILPTLETLPTWLGIDVGRLHDPTVVWVTQRVQSLERTSPLILEIKNLPLENQRQIIAFVVEGLQQFVSLAIDAGGLGLGLAESLADTLGDRCVDQIKFTDKFYLENWPLLKAALEDRLLTMPRDADVLNDHRALQLVRGIPKLPKAKTQSSSGGKRHGDSAIANLLGFYASQTEQRSYGLYEMPKSTATPGLGSLSGARIGF